MTSYTWVILELDEYEEMKISLKKDKSQDKEGWKKPSRFLSVLIDKVAEKHDMHTSIVANYIRTKLSFEIVRSQVLCIRGSRTLRKAVVDVGDVEVVQHVAGIRE